jgi:hypothetical protein
LKKIIEEFQLKNQMAKTFTRLDNSNTSNSGVNTPLGMSPKKSTTQVNFYFHVREEVPMEFLL